MSTIPDNGRPGRREASPRDRAIQQAVIDELEWTPGVDVARIGVSVHDGVVRLEGEPATFAEALAARKAALHVSGVAAVVDELEVQRGKWHGLSDTEVAEHIATALDRSSDVPRHAVQAAVRDGVVTLTGQVEWQHQREAARRTVERLAGVRAVHDRIALTPRTSSSDTAERIRRALRRSAVLDGDDIVVTADGTEVVLSGAVRSAIARREAVLAAWSSPHVSVVHDRLRVTGAEPSSEG